MNFRILFGAFVAIFFALVPPMGHAVAEETEFFGISIALDKQVFYEGERLPVTTSIANETEGPLKYMLTGDLPCRWTFIVSADGREALRRNGNAPFGQQPDWGKGLDRTLGPGQSQERRCEFIHLNRGYAWKMDPRGLPPGKYTLKAVLENAVPEFDLAIGRAESNEVKFTVKEWAPKRKVCKTTPSAEGWYRNEALVETTAGDVLATWGDMTLVVPLPFRFDIAAAKWWVDGDTIYILVPEDAGQPERLIIVGPNCYKPTVVEPQESVVMQVE